MAWTDPTTQPQFQYQDLSNVQFVQQPTPQPVTILQQLPAAVASPVPSLHPGHIREDLVELMMMQNAQMHQVIMSNMTMSALSTFGYTCSPEHLGPPVAAEDDAEVFHHYYPYNPALSHSVWMPPLTGPQIPQLQTIPSFHHPSDPLHTAHTQHRERSAVPPPPPRSVTGTVGAEVPPVTDIYEAERRQHETEETHRTDA
ncbi:proline-rich protein 29-like isoform X1 [Astyanax mexicanus]|uniref:Proline rich 29 n=2 Tax=Astyanax mexicanus TaxID=7994 RepID=A0A3B1J1I8_ASTMX|nr:proline-rich protein 29-like isoform X1 [Astyanax mexicanus]